MRRVVGLDLSLRSTGIGIVTDTARGAKLAHDVIKANVTRTGPKDAKGKSTETFGDRYRRMSELAKDVTHHAFTADLVVIEGFFVSPGVGVQDRAALWWVVAGALYRRGVPVAVISPTSVKLAIAGKGKADKVEVALAVQKLWPGADLGNNDSADAIGMAHLGAVALGWPVNTLERHRQVKWTEFPDITSAGAVPIGGVA